MSDARLIPESTLDVLQWAERCAEGAQKQLLESAKMLSDQASTTVTVLLAGLGGALGLAVKVFESAPVVAKGAPLMPATAGAAVVCIYLSLLTVLVLHKCMAAASIPLMYNEPANLVQKDQPLHRLLQAELNNRQAAIDQLRRRNATRAKWLNRVRMAAAATPLVFAVGAWFAR